MGIVVTLTLLWIVAYTTQAQNYTLLLGLSRRCPPAFLDVDHHKDLYVESIPVDLQEFQTNRRHEECSVSLKTGLVDHGLCLSVLNMTLSCDVDVLFRTNPYESDKKIDCEHDRPSEWCTTEPLTTITLKARHSPRSALDGPTFKFLIKVQAVPLEHIRKMYYMDSRLGCGVEHQLQEGESARLFSHRRPLVNSKKVPMICEVTFITSGSGEYEQVCLKFDKLMSDCETDLMVKPLLAPHWAPNETFNCISEVDEKEEFCSSDKELTVRLTRKSITNSEFAITVRSKRHTYWEYDEEVKRELVGLAIVRGLIFVVSVINTVIAITIAVIVFLHRNPLSTYRQWSIHSILYIPHVDNNRPILTTPNDTGAYPSQEKSQCDQPVI